MRRLEDVLEKTSHDRCERLLDHLEFRVRHDGEELGYVELDAKSFIAQSVFLKPYVIRRSKQILSASLCLNKPMRLTYVLSRIRDYTGSDVKDVSSEM